MVLLGNWQLDRYQGRHRDQRADRRRRQRMAPGPLADALRRPDRRRRHGRSGPRRRQRPGPGSPPPAGTTRRTSVLVRGRTVEQPGRLRGAHPAACSPTAPPCWWTGAGSRPRRAGRPRSRRCPPRPPATVTVAGRVRGQRERRRRGGPARRPAGDPADRACPGSPGELPYPVYGGYVLLDEQTPAADPPSRRCRSATEQLAELRLRRAVVAVRRDGPVRLRLGGPPGGAPGGRPRHPASVDRAAEPTPSAPA